MSVILKYKTIILLITTAIFIIIIHMSYKAAIDVGVHIHAIRTLLFKHQGIMKIRLSIHREDQDKSVYGQPYNVLSSSSNNNKCQSQTSISEDWYSSKAISIKNQQTYYQINETCLFKLYVDSRQFSNAQIRCVAEVLFSSDPVETKQTDYQLYGSYSSIIKRVHGVLEYVPFVLDEYGGFVLDTLFCATVMEFKFIKDEQEWQFKGGYESFWHYLEAVTFKFEKNKTTEYYNYYRGFLEAEFDAMQKNYSRMLACVCGQPVFYNPLVFLKNNKLHIQFQRLNYIWNADFRTMVVDEMMQDFLSVKAACYEFWNQFMIFMLANSQAIVDQFRMQHQIKSIQRSKSNVLSQIVKNCDWTLARCQQAGKSNLLHAEREKLKDYSYFWNNENQAEREEYFADIKITPKIFEQVYSLNRESIGSNQQTHVIIMVHGFQASRSDFYDLKNFIKAACGSNTQVYISCVNECRTHADISILGQRLAIEISDFLTQKMSNKNYRLSFIGHSMGGIIIRAALQYLEKYWTRLYNFITFSSPHLGYLENDSAVVYAGLWYLRSWEQCESINQLMMTDSKDLTKCLLYKLSQSKALSWFRNMILMSSPQDGLIGYHSARIQKSQRVIYESKHNHKIAQIICQMAENMLPCSLEKLHRIDVVFDIPSHDLDSLVGRTAHIKFITDRCFLKTFVNSFIHFFV